MIEEASVFVVDDDRQLSRVFGTGIGLYRSDTVGYDLVKGQAVITPAG